jgi:hypothetical protein
MITALRHFLTDLERIPQPGQYPTDSEGNPVDLGDKKAEDPTVINRRAETWEDIRDRLRHQLGAIRKADWKEGTRSIDHRQTVLLSERIFFLQWTRDSYAAARADGLELDCIKLVELILKWADVEKATKVGSVTTQDAWGQLSKTVMANPALHRLVADDFRMVVGVRKANKWMQWLHRGRRNVIEGIGRADRARYLFPHWFNRSR